MKHDLAEARPRRRLAKILIYVSAAPLVCAVLLYAALCVASFFVTCPALDSSGGAVVWDRAGNLLYVERAPGDVMSFPRSSTQMSPWLLRCVVAVEDERFFEHAGVDPLAILRAAVSNLSAGRRVSGASTIEMQVARLCGGMPRHWFGKFEQAATAMALARRYDKRRLLEVWLNRASFGGDLIGCEAAALHWFQKRAKDLALHEAALLVGLPQSPERLRPDRYPDAARARRNHVLQRLETLGWIDAQTATRTQAMDLGLCSKVWPQRVPQLARAALLAAPTGNARELCLTIDLALQTAVEEVLERAAPAVRERGAHHLAAILVENETGCVRAWVGSQAPHGLSPGAQVDHARAWRSAGSTLKPFLYARAFELGIATADTELEDRARSYANYLPQNFDGVTRGVVSAAEALALSLNLPAIELLDRMGVPTFCAVLGRCELLQHGEVAETHGLALALGSAAVRLDHLVAAYACLGRGGLWLPLRRSLQEQAGLPRRIFEPHAAEAVCAALRDARYSPLAELAPGCLEFAIKTGTSSGARDAWCLATSATWTVGVWMGNPDGTPTTDLSGRQSAAPVLAEIVQRLPRGADERWAPQRVQAEKRDLLQSLAHRSKAPQLLSPLHGSTYYGATTKDVQREQAAALRLRFELGLPAGAEGPWRWWLDGYLLESSAPLMHLDISPGRHLVRVSHDGGWSAEAQFQVEPR